MTTTRAHSRRGNALRRHCEERSDEAIHASACRAMDCFASLAMTLRRAPAKKPSIAPSFRGDAKASNPNLKFFALPRAPE